MAKKPKASTTPAASGAAAVSAAQPAKAAAAASATASGSPFAQLLASYTKNTPQLLRMIDVYLACVMLSGIIQFAYVVLVGTFPYNSFLSGFIASVGSFVLA
ncbi:Dolichyl-diphosphooligosaccharide-protein glycosyltransferase subunit dad1, partial [Entophlyctis luteolus]